jgi:hypothetical protein
MMRQFKSPDGFVPGEEHGSAQLLSGHMRKYLGVTFRLYRTAMWSREWRSDDARIVIERRFHAKTFSVYVDGNLIPKNFRFERTAAKAGIELRNKKDGAK